MSLLTTGDNGRLDVLLAAARERLADAHLVHSLDFIQRVAADIEAPRALDIYCRLHHLDEHDTRTLKNRVLASFGETRSGSGSSPTFVSVNGDVEWDVTASMLFRLRRRLGGRRNHRLRRWIELHTAHVEGRLLRVHAENVERLLEETGTLDGAYSETIRLYTRALGIRDSLIEAISISALERLYPDTNVPRKVELKVQRGRGGDVGGTPKKRKAGPLGA